MSIQRSPTNKNKQNCITQASSSFPDLSNLHDESIVNLRKRKEPSFEQEIKKDIHNLQNDLSNMMTFLKDFCDKQNNKLLVLCEDVCSIKTKLNEISASNVELKQEQNKIKLDIQNLQLNNEEINKQFSAMNSEIKDIKTNISSQPIFTQDTNIPETQINFIHEIEDRINRANNIIIRDIKELKNDNTQERQMYDNQEVHKILKSIYEECPYPLKVIRLGKLNDQKPRPIKVCFQSSETVKRILRTKDKYSNNYRITSDQTPLQITHLHNLRDQLTKRLHNGETNIAIKYIKGVPKIVSTKN